MTLIWMDSFDDRSENYGDKYDSFGNTMEQATGRTGNGVKFPTAVFPLSHDCFLRKNVAAYPTYIQGIAVFVINNVLQATPILRLLDGATVQVYVRMNTNRSLSVYNGDGTLLAGPSTTLLSTSAFIYIEFKATIHQTLGNFTLRMDESEVLSGTNVDTQNSATAQITALDLVNLPIDSSASLVFDDYYIADDQGSINNTFLGTLKIPYLKPNGAGVTTEWEIGGDTPAATNHESVDDATPDDEDTTVASATEGTLDLYALENLGIDSGEIVGIQAGFRGKLDIAGGREVCKVLRSNGANYDGDGRALSADWQNFYEVNETDPDTDALWEIAAIDALQAGIKVTA